MPSAPICFSLPWPPMDKMTSEEGREFYAAAAREAPRMTRPMRQRVSVVIEAHPPNGSWSDFINLLKSTLDALQHTGIYEDNSQVDELQIRRFPPRPAGRIDLTISELPIS